MEHICIVAEGYPTDDNPIFSFVDQLVCAIADMGHKCSVIAPQSVTKAAMRSVRLRPKQWSKSTKQGNKINVYQPYYFSFSNNRMLSKISDFMIDSAVKKEMSRINSDEKITVVYAHFWHCGVSAGFAAQKLGLPLFVACGESSISVHRRYSQKKIKKALVPLKGVISVSTENKEDSVKLGLAKAEQITVLPNGYDSDVFYEMNKSEARKKLNISENDFVIAFLGSFNERKGVNRLSDAITKTGLDIKSIFIGAGELTPECNGIIFKGKLAHEKIVTYLNAADVFVLPTLAEGCCNAIIEAMACGLPVVSSNGKFNDDILDKDCSIRIDANDTEILAKTIEMLYNNKNECVRLSQGAKKRADSLKIEQRASDILLFMEKKKD